MEKALPRPRATSCLLAFPPSSVEEVPKGRERPGLLLFLSLTNQSTGASPTTSSFPGEQIDVSGIAPCQVNSRCAQLDLACSRPWSFTCQRRACRLEN